jgi:hypothetical protein
MCISAIEWIARKPSVSTTRAHKVDLNPLCILGLPYRCEQTVIPTMADVAATMATFEQLVEDYKDHQE